MPRALNFVIQGMLSGVYNNTKEEIEILDTLALFLHVRLLST